VILQRAKDTFVFVVGADPKPIDCVSFKQAKNAVIIGYTHRINGAMVAHALEA